MLLLTTSFVTFAQLPSANQLLTERHGLRSKYLVEYNVLLKLYVHSTLT